MLDIKSAKFFKSNPLTNKSKTTKSLSTISFIVLFCILFTLINPILSFDTPVNMEERFRHASKLQKVSNNKIRYGYDQQMGIYCVANDFIKAKEFLYDVPKSMSISPLYIFPFKFEILDILKEIPIIQQSIGRDQTLASYMLLFQVLIYRYAPLNSLKRYIRDHDFSDYYDFFEPDEEMYESFPKFVPSLYNYGEEDVNLLIKTKLGYTKLKELGIVYEHVNSKLIEKFWAVDLIHAFSDLKVFQETYALVISRTMTINMNEFYLIEGYTENTPGLTPLQKKNIQINKEQAKNGIPTVISYIDICNHSQPKSFPGRNKNIISITAKKGFFSHFSSSDFKPGEEYVFNYTFNPQTLALSLNYGFTLKKNIFDLTEVTVKDNYTFSMDQINLCREIGCFPTDIRTPGQITKERKETISYNQLNENLLNYGRVRALKGKIDNKKLYKKLMQDKFFSKSNELSSYIFYFNQIKDELKSEQNILLEVIHEGSVFKQKLKNVENLYSDEDPESIINWKKTTVRNLIYETAFHLKYMLVVHSNKILEKIIQKNNDGIQNIKAKYLNKFN